MQFRLASIPRHHQGVENVVAIAGEAGRCEVSRERPCGESIKALARADLARVTYTMHAEPQRPTSEHLTAQHVNCAQYYDSTVAVVVPGEQNCFFP